MRLIEGECRLFSYQLRYAGATDPGRVRPGNEDDLLIVAECGVFAVADGLGGLEAGDVASRTALMQLQQCLGAGKPEKKSWFGSSPAKTGGRPLTEILKEVNSRIYRERLAAGRNMATTLALVRLDSDQAAVAHVGDSRVYLWRDERLQQLTSDHSLVNELFAQGVLTAEQMEHSPQRHVITRAIGAEPDVVPSVRQGDLRMGDVYLLCTDGLTGMLSDTEIAGLLHEEGQPPAETVRQLIAAANRKGGRDNITVVLLRLTR